MRPAEHIVTRHAANNIVQTRRVEEVCQTKNGRADGTRAKSTTPRRRGSQRQVSIAS